MRVTVRPYAHREAIVTIRPGLLARLLGARERVDVVVGDSLGAWWWHTTGRRVEDKRIVRKIEERLT